MIKTIKIVLIAISLIFNFSITLRAQSISYNQQFQIFENAIYNTNTACLNDGGYIVCGRGPFGNYEIYAQIFNADHSRRGNEFRVNTNTYLEQDYPDVFCLSDTTIIITWTSWDGIYGQLLKYDGTKINPEFNIAPNGSVAQRMAKLNNGGFVICWVDEQWSDGSYVNDIYASIYDKNITKIGDSFLINTHVEDLQHKPKIAVLKSGEFIVSWISNNQDGIRTGVYYKIFSDAGDEVCDELRATPTANTYTPHYDLCALNDGGFVFIWPNGLNDYRYPDIIVQRFDSNFVKYDDIVQTRAATSTKGVGISSLENGGYVFFWELYNDLFGQFINEGNSKYRNEFKINTISNSTAYNNDPRAIQLKNNDIFFTWVQANPTYFKIYGKHFLEKLVHPLLPYNLTYPLSHETITSTTQTLKWRQPTNLHYNYSWDIEYKIFLDTIPDFINPLIFFGIYDTSYTIQNLEPGIKYYWKVLAKNLDGDSLWSDETNSFFVSQSLISFSLLQPQSDETIKFTNPTLKWNHASGQSFNSPWKLDYHVYLDKNESFSNPEIYSVVKDTSCIVDSLFPGTTYFWKVLAKDILNDSLWSSETNGFFVSHDATGIKHQTTNNKSQTFELYANYPNPFNPETTIKYALSVDQSVYQVKVKIYDALGRVITTLINEPQNPGMHTVKWNGKNMSGQNMPSGIYFCVVEAGSFKATQKMLLVR